MEKVRDGTKIPQSKWDKKHKYRGTPEWYYRLTGDDVHEHKIDARFPDRNLWQTYATLEEITDELIEAGITDGVTAYSEVPILAYCQEWDGHKLVYADWTGIDWEPGPIALWVDNNWVDD